MTSALAVSAVIAGVPLTATLITWIITRKSYGVKK